MFNAKLGYCTTILTKSGREVWGEESGHPAGAREIPQTICGEKVTTNGVSFTYVETGEPVEGDAWADLAEFEQARITYQTCIDTHLDESYAHKPMTRGQLVHAHRNAQR